jgi:hypothetical protein
MQDIEVRIKILTCFRDAVREWSSGKQTDELRSYINRNLMAVQTAVKDVGTFQTITVGPPPAIGGGLVLADQNPFLHIFRSLYGRSVIPMVVDMIEQAIGVYEYMRDNSGLVRIQSPEAIDIETAIERALRPHFRKSPPKSETAVQDSIETILNALGIDFRREKDTAPIAGDVHSDRISQSIISALQ